MFDPTQVLNWNRQSSSAQWILKWSEKRFRNPLLVHSAPPLPSVLAEFAFEDLMPKEEQPAA